MVTQRRMDEPNGSDSEGRVRGPGIGTLLFTTACGIGLGLLTAPETGRQTRRRLRKRLATMGGEMIDRWGEVQDRFGEVREAGTQAGRRVRKGMRNRVAELRDEAEDRWKATQARLADLEEQLERMQEDEEDEGEARSGTGGLLSAALGLAVGAGVAYFLIADDAASARSKVQQMASDVRQQATDRWQQFRRGGAQAPAETSTFTDEV